MTKVVISYRRQDSEQITGRIHDHLVHRFGEKSVYIDIASAPAAMDYRDHIKDAIKHTDLLVAVIGKEWTGPRATGSARIFDPDDLVRIEIETALSARVPVMPVLVNGARMPTASELPASIANLPFINAVEVKSGADFHAQIRQLIRSIDRLVAFNRLRYVSKFIALPIFFLLMSDYLLLFKLDLPPVFLRVALALISAALGVGLCFEIGHGARPALILGAGVGLAAVIGMVMINAALSIPPSFSLQAIVPSNTREWQETIEYFVTITAATLAGNVLASAFRARKVSRQIVE